MKSERAITVKHCFLILNPSRKFLVVKRVRWYLKLSVGKTWVGLNTKLHRNSAINVKQLNNNNSLLHKCYANFWYRNNFLLSLCSIMQKYSPETWRSNWISYKLAMLMLKHSNDTILPRLFQIWKSFQALFYWHF